MLIESSSPKEVPAKTYRHWWIGAIMGTTTNPDTPQQSFGIAFTFVRGNKSEGGAWELSSDPTDSVTYPIQDVFAAAAQDPEIAQLIGGLLAKATSLAKADGVID